MVDYFLITNDGVNMYALRSDGSSSLMTFDSCNGTLRRNSEGNSVIQYVVSACVLFVKQHHNSNNNNDNSNNNSSSILQLFKIDCEIKGKNRSYQSFLYPILCRYCIWDFAADLDMR